MPQQKQTDAFEGFADLPEITEKQHSFVIAILGGKSASDAYRESYDTSNMTPASIWCNASKLRANAKVAPWFDAHRMAGVSRGKRTLAQHLDRLTDLSVKAELSGNYGAAVNAEHHAGKASGLYVDRVEDVTKRSDPREALAKLLGADLADRLIERQGEEADSADA